MFFFLRTSLISKLLNNNIVCLLNVILSLNHVDISEYLPYIAPYVVNLCSVLGIGC